MLGPGGWQGYQGRALNYTYFAKEYSGVGLHPPRCFPHQLDHMPGCGPSGCGEIGPSHRTQTVAPPQPCVQAGASEHACSSFSLSLPEARHPHPHCPPAQGPITPLWSPASLFCLLPSNLPAQPLRCPSERAEGLTFLLQHLEGSL